MPPDTRTDMAYGDAMTRAMARALAQLYVGLMAEGVPEPRASEWVARYVAALGSRTPAEATEK